MEIYFYKYFKIFGFYYRALQRNIFTPLFISLPAILPTFFAKEACNCIFKLLTHTRSSWAESKGRAEPPPPPRHPERSVAGITTHVILSGAEAESKGAAK